MACLNYYNEIPGTNTTYTLQISLPFSCLHEKYFHLRESKSKALVAM